MDTSDEARQHVVCTGVCEMKAKKKKWKRKGRTSRRRADRIKRASMKRKQ